MENFLIAGYILDKKGGGTAVDPNNLCQNIQEDQLCWLHLDGNKVEAQNWLREKSGIDPLVVDAMVAKETRPRFALMDESALIILKGVNGHIDSRDEGLTSIRIFIQKNRIISVCLKNILFFSKIDENIKNRVGPTTLPAFISQVLYTIFLSSESLLDRMDESLDQIEDRYDKHAKVDSTLLSDISEVRSKAIILKRYWFPQREVVRQMIQSTLPWIDQRARKKLEENLETSTRYIEDLDVIRERAIVILDEIRQQTADQSSKNMYVFSVVAVLFLPLTFITGLFGVNLGGIPGFESPQAFTIFGAILFALTVISIGLFKIFKWI